MYPTLAKQCDDKIKLSVKCLSNDEKDLVVEKCLYIKYQYANLLLLPHFYDMKEVFQDANKRCCPNAKPYE